MSFGDLVNFTLILLNRFKVELMCICLQTVVDQNQQEHSNTKLINRGINYRMLLLIGPADCSICHICVRTWSILHIMGLVFHEKQKYCLIWRRSVVISGLTRWCRRVDIRPKVPKGLRICGRGIGEFGAVARLRAERMKVFFFLRRLAGEGWDGSRSL